MNIFCFVDGFLVSNPTFQKAKRPQSKIKTRNKTNKQNFKNNKLSFPKAKKNKKLINKFQNKFIPLFHHILF